MPDEATVAACRWLLAGGQAGGYDGPDPGPDHDLAPLLSRETGRKDITLLAEAEWVRREEVLRSVLERIHGAGGTVWAFKGFDLARSLYPFTGARPMSDVDIFFRPFQRDLVLDAFRYGGWSPGSPGGGVFASGIVSEMKLRKLDVLVELHSHIFYFPALFPGVLPRDLYGAGRDLSPGLKAFSWHNTLLLVILHMLVNRGHRPVWWVDLALLCQKVTLSGRWREFSFNASRTGFGHSVASILRAASRGLSAQVPEKDLEILERGGNRSESLLEGLRFGRGMPTAMNLRYLRGWKKISWLYSLLWMLVSRRRPVAWNGTFSGDPQD